MASVTGYWKGLAVTREQFVVVRAFLEADGSTIVGRYELEGTTSDLAKGEVVGSVSREEITLTFSGGSHFSGQIAGESPAGPFLFGLVALTREASPIGTLTLVQMSTEPTSPIRAYA